MMPVVMTMAIMPMGAPIRNSQNALHTTDRSADASADRAADNSTDGSGCAIASTNAFLSPADNSLRVRSKRHRQHRKKRERPEQASRLRGIHG
jgi:hypothetical protein